MLYRRRKRQTFVLLLFVAAALSETGDGCAYSGGRTTASLFVSSVERSGGRSLQRPSGSLPPASIRELPHPKNEIDRDLLDLKLLNEEMQRVAARLPADYANLAWMVSDTQILARRLERRLFFTGGDRGNKRPEGSGNLQLSETLAALDVAVTAFISNATQTNQTGAVDLDSLNSNRVWLEKILMLSSQLLELPPLKTASKASNSKLHKGINRNLTSIQLESACAAWNVKTFSVAPSRITRKGSTRVEEIKVQEIRHRLEQEVLVDITDCVDALAYEKAVAAQARYGATINSFVSYEVDGRVFAYQVIYQAGLTKNGRFVQHYGPPLTYYFVDETGDGEFELFDPTTSSSFVPNWVREIAVRTSVPK